MGFVKSDQNGGRDDRSGVYPEAEKEGSGRKRGFRGEQEREKQGGMTPKRGTRVTARGDIPKEEGGVGSSKKLLKQTRVGKWA